MNVVARISKAFLLLISWFLVVFWMVQWCNFPTPGGKVFKSKVSTRVGASTFYGNYATNIVLYILPVIALAVFALLYLEVDKRFPEKTRSTSGKLSLLVRIYRAMWTQPLLVKTPLGILTFIDILGILVVLFCSAWIWAQLLVPQFNTVNSSKSKKGMEKWQMKLDQTSAMLGRVLPFNVALLFLPIGRGSPILRLIDLPFEQAVRYHRWSGNLAVLLVAIHGATYAILVGSMHQLHLLGEWAYTGISNVAGVIAAVSGIVIAITSLPCVRARHFNFFFRVHHLYLVFIAFYAFHVNWNHMSASLGPIFLFFIDRFLRMVQSRRLLSGVSARVLPSGVVELKIPKNPGFNYSALSFMYINIPGLSRLQWHPFSTTSSPLDDSNEVSVCIKPLGDWTHSLHAAISAKSAHSSDSKVSCPFAVKLHAEGPYGHESNYFLRYKNLILIAGGIGVTPYLAIIRDLLKRYELQQEDLPSHVQLIWCVRRSSELATLRGIRPTQIYSSYALERSKRFKLTVRAYVTGEEPKSFTPSMEHHVSELENELETSNDTARKPSQRMAAISPNENLWVMFVVIASMTGFILISALFHIYVVTPNNTNEDPFSQALEVFIFFVSMFIAIVFCGGAVILAWIATKQVMSSSNCPTSNGHVQDLKMRQLTDLEGNDETLLDNCVTTEGSRPNFPEIFADYSAKHEREEVGVLVCGPESLQQSVAAQCRSQNFGSWKTPFHFHSISFDL